MSNKHSEAESVTTTPRKPEHFDVVCEEDLVVVRTRGAIDESMAKYLGTIHDKLALQCGYALQLQICHPSTTLTVEARHSFFQWNRKRKYPGVVAVVGASFATKTVVMLLGRAVKLLVDVRSDIEYFDSEAQARSWLNEQRIAMNRKSAT
jgi:hypothetical protein